MVVVVIWYVSTPEYDVLQREAPSRAGRFGTLLGRSKADSPGLYIEEALSPLFGWRPCLSSSHLGAPLRFEFEIVHVVYHNEPGKVRARHKLIIIRR